MPRELVHLIVELIPAEALAPCWPEKARGAFL